MHMGLLTKIIIVKFFIDKLWMFMVKLTINTKVLKV